MKTRFCSSAGRGPASGGGCGASRNACAASRPKAAASSCQSSTASRISAWGSSRCCARCREKKRRVRRCAGCGSRTSHRPRCRRRCGGLSAFWGNAEPGERLVEALAHLQLRAAIERHGLAEAIRVDERLMAVHRHLQEARWGPGGEQPLLGGDEQAERIALVLRRIAGNGARVEEDAAEAERQRGFDRAVIGVLCTAHAEHAGQAGKKIVLP